MLNYDELHIEDITAIKDYKKFFSEVPLDTTIVICGGDGTLNRFINDTKKIRINHELLYYPCGNGNDFSRDVGFSHALLPLKDYIQGKKRNDDLEQKSAQAYRVRNTMEKNTNVKSQILTIPNLLSLFRIILIPFIVWAYFGIENNYVAIALIILSGATDIVDGFIARKFNMISEVGKVLDPIADKLTQGTVMICLTLKCVWMRALIVAFVLKEVTMGILGLITLKKVGEVNSAKWYGKANTVLLYVVMGVLVLFPQINVNVANVMILVCFVSLVLSLLMYIRFYSKNWKENKVKNG